MRPWSYRGGCLLQGGGGFKCSEMGWGDEKVKAQITLKERLLDQAQVRAPYTPPLGGIRVAYPNV